MEDYNNTIKQYCEKNFFQIFGAMGYSPVSPFIKWGFCLSQLKQAFKNKGLLGGLLLKKSGEPWHILYFFNFMRQLGYRPLSLHRSRGSCNKRTHIENSKRNVFEKQRKNVLLYRKHVMIKSQWSRYWLLYTSSVPWTWHDSYIHRRPCLQK